MPGIVAVYFFYRAGRTREVDPVIPAMTSALGFFQIGTFAVLVHFINSVGLWLVSRLPPCFALPLPDPYLLLRTSDIGLDNFANRLALFSGLLLVIGVAAVVGHVCGQIAGAQTNRAIFDGALHEVLSKAEGPGSYINAYVLTKISHDDKFLGYEGTVVALTRDSELLPTRVVLRNARPFHIEIVKSGAQRNEDGTIMQSLVLSAGDWHNIAFKVYAVEED